MLMLLMLACAPAREVDPSEAVAACADGLDDVCEAVVLDDARYRGWDLEGPHVASGLVALLLVSPDWYADTLSSWRSLDTSGPVDGSEGEHWVASTWRGRVTVHAPLLWSDRMLAATFVHEAAHAARPEGSLHVPCEWGQCDDGEAADGYPMMVAFLEDSGWDDWETQQVLDGARKRSGGVE
jgi:hypothetical protein